MVSELVIFACALCPVWDTAHCHIKLHAEETFKAAGWVQVDEHWICPKHTRQEAVDAIDPAKLELCRQQLRAVLAE